MVENMRAHIKICRCWIASHLLCQQSENGDRLLRIIFPVATVVVSASSATMIKRAVARSRQEPVGRA